MHPRIHPTAVIHPKAELDPTVTVGPYCVIGDGVRIGPGTVLHNHVTVQGPAVIGAENEIFPYVVLGAEPQDLKYKGHDTALILGDRNKVREHATIHRGTELGGEKTVIGSDCLIMVGVHIAHDCHIHDHVVIANGTMLGGHCRVEERAGIGGGVGIHHFTTIGRLSFTGGFSRITHDVPPYLVVEGAPAEPRKVNSVALSRAGWDGAHIDRLRAAYRLIFRQNGIPAADAIDALRRETGQLAAVLELCDFLERVQMGVHGRQAERQRSQPGSDSAAG
jgi:UDP-N-acetylglucosamine acyltransferase